MKDRFCVRAICVCLPFMLPACGSSTDTGKDQGSAGSSDGPTTCTTEVGERGSMLIDDFEDGDSQLFQPSNRHGFWYSNNDGTGIQAPPADPSGMKPFRPSSPGSPSSPKYALRTVGWGFESWGAFVSTSLATPALAALCPYDASAFSGIRLNAKGTGNLRVTVGTTLTTTPSNGGECGATVCSDYGKDVELSSDWTELKIPFDELSVPNWASPVPWDPRKIAYLSFWVASGDFDIWIDDVGFL